MAQPSANSLKGQIAALKEQLMEATRERLHAIREANEATEATRRVTRELSEKLNMVEQDKALALMAAEDRVKQLKAACAGLEREVAERDGYIRRVNEGDDAKAELAPSEPIELQPRTHAARRNGASVAFWSGGYTNGARAVDWHQV